MAKHLFRIYRRLMIRSYLVSLAGAVFMMLTALHEFGWTAWRVVQAKDVDEGLVAWWLSLELIVAVAFGVRTIVVWRIQAVSYFLVAASSIFCYALSWFYFQASFPGLGRGAVYSLFDQGLASWMIGFFVLGFLRFCVTFLASTTQAFSDEFGSYS